MSDWQRIAALRETNSRQAAAKAQREKLLLDEHDDRDASMKRNTAMIRKIRTISTESMEGIVQECRELKMTKYLGEVAGALCELRLKQAADVALLTDFSSFLHQQYDEWRAHLAARLQVQLTSSLEVARLRIMLRWTTELLFVGVLDDWNLLTGTLKSCLVEDDEGGRKVLSIATMLAKNFYPHRSEMPCAQEFDTILRNYFKAMCRSMLRAHHHFTGLQRSARRFYEQKGDLSTERSEEIKAAHEVFDRMQVALQTLAEALNETLPRTRSAADGEEEVEMQEGRMVFKALIINEAIWETEEDKLFYEQLPITMPASEEEMDGMEVLDAAIAQDPDAAITGQDDDLGKSLSTLMPRILEMHTAEAVDKLAADLMTVMTGRSQRKRFIEV